jgi:hypothetical protein
MRTGGFPGIVCAATSGSGTTGMSVYELRCVETEKASGETRSAQCRNSGIPGLQSWEDINRLWRPTLLLFWSSFHNVLIWERLNWVQSYT